MGDTTQFPRPFLLPGAHRTIKLPLTNFFAFRATFQALRLGQCAFQSLVQTGAFSLPISPLPLGCLPSPTHTDRKGFKTGRLEFSSSPGGGSYLFPRAWVFLFVGVFSLSETRKLNLPNGQTQKDYRFFLQEPAEACRPSLPIKSHSFTNHPNRGAAFWSPGAYSIPLFV